MRSFGSIVLIGFILGTTPSRASGLDSGPDSGTRPPLHVVTTTTDLASVVRDLDPSAIVQSLAQGAEDPHDIEAKPSFMSALSRSDLLITNGAGLEDGWLPRMIKMTQRDRPQLGILVAADSVSLSNSGQGGEHAKGNPHFMLDPEMVIRVGQAIAKRLGELRPNSKLAVDARFKSWKQDLEDAEGGWKKTMANSSYRSVVTYHAGLDYFLNRFGIEDGGTLEPEPGAQPTASHILALEKVMKAKKIRLILVEHYDDESQARRLNEDVPGSLIRRAYVATNAKSNLVHNKDLIQDLVDLFSDHLEKAETPRH